MSEITCMDNGGQLMTPKERESRPAKALAAAILALGALLIVLVVPANPTNAASRTSPISVSCPAGRFPSVKFVITNTSSSTRTQTIGYSRTGGEPTNDWHPYTKTVNYSVPGGATRTYYLHMGAALGGVRSALFAVYQSSSSLKLTYTSYCSTVG